MPCRVLEALPRSFEAVLGTLEAGGGDAVRNAALEEQRLVQQDLILQRFSHLARDNLLTWVLRVRSQPLECLLASGLALMGLG